MTNDKDIIKALECCRDTVNNSNCCKLCPYYEVEDCAVASANDILDLITRQQAENERLEVENQSLRGAANSLKMHYEKAQSEIERLKEKCHNYYSSIDSYCVSRKAVEIKDIDNLVKEMVGNNG